LLVWFEGYIAIAKLLLERAVILDGERTQTQHLRYLKAIEA
jgi:hypothetical protein